MTTKLLALPPLAEIEEAMGMPLADWAQQCHAASAAIVHSGILDRPCRVARGSCRGVFGQHSWVVLGDNCYDQKVTVIDPTLWSYDDTVEGIWVGKANVRPHSPHGLWAAGPKGKPVKNIFAWGRPPEATDDPIELTPNFDLSDSAKMFIEMLGPLDYNGWAMLVNHAPVGGWPAGEIIAAMCDTPAVRSAPPIDLVGMLTDRNPGGLYR